MCGRFAFHATADELLEAFGVIVAPDLEPRYNIAPSQPVPVIRADQDGERHMDLLRWGLVPSWAKDSKIGNRLINARAETVAEKPAFRSAYKRRRCLIAASGFFEWQASPGGKIPMYISDPSGRPYAFAGLWERWQQAGAAPLETCLIVTVAANNVLQPVHERMPAVLDADAQATWLSALTPAQDCRSLLRPAAERFTRFWPVSRKVNNPAHEGPDLLVPVEAI